MSQEFSRSLAGHFPKGLILKRRRSSFQRGTMASARGGLPGGEVPGGGERRTKSLRKDGDCTMKLWSLFIINQPAIVDG